MPWECLSVSPRLIRNGYIPFDIEFFAERFDRGIDVGGGDQCSQTLKDGHLSAQLRNKLSGSLFLAQFNGLQQVREDLTRVLESWTRGLRPALSLASAYR